MIRGKQPVGPKIECRSTSKISALRFLMGHSSTKSIAIVLVNCSTFTIVPTLLDPATNRTSIRCCGERPFPRPFHQNASQAQHRSSLCSEWQVSPLNSHLLLRLCAATERMSPSSPISRMLHLNRTSARALRRSQQDEIDLLDFNNV